MPAQVRCRDLNFKLLPLRAPFLLPVHRGIEQDHAARGTEGNAVDVSLRLRQHNASEEKQAPRKCKVYLNCTQLGLI